MDRTPGSSGSSKPFVNCVNGLPTSHKSDDDAGEEAEIERTARIDRDRTERDRLAKRGYDIDRTAPSHPKFEPATWRRHGPFNSRQPELPPAIAAKIEAIEAEARCLGWPPQRLWNANFWDAPRGLAAVLDEGDEITEVTADYIKILKTKRDLVRFYRTH
jgi:hypothetical protein